MINAISRRYHSTSRYYIVLHILLKVRSPCETMALSYHMENDKREVTSKAVVTRYERKLIKNRPEGRNEGPEGSALRSQTNIHII